MYLLMFGRNFSLYYNKSSLQIIVGEPETFRHEMWPILAKYMYYYSMDIQSLQVNHNNIVSGHIGYLKHMHVGGDDVTIIY